MLIETGAREAVISSEATFTIECLLNQTQTLYRSSRPVRITNQAGRLQVANRDGFLLEEGLEEINILPQQPKPLRVNDRPYRGLFKIVPQGQGELEVVNVVAMEEYLRGVIPPELGKRERNELEAIKAQAVAARTYALRHLGQYSNGRYDLKGDIMDQVYEGVAVEYDLVDKAIRETTGWVAMYNDEFIQAYYHSTSGGMTDAIGDVWDRNDLPYLQAVSDSGASSWSKYYRWQEHFSEPQLRQRLERYLSAERGVELRLDPITDLEIIRRSPGGRVMELVVRTKSDVHRLYKDKVRWAFRRSSNPDLILPSARFDLDILRDPEGNIVRVTFEGSGYGHGVGMCQCSAIEMSRRGWDYKRILSHFYAGIELKKLY
ncbi:SpoIID/LytB domain-containing protein [candidate division GN15 bacterium]|nr:SpoIID/LytB domain-containing protein [candidate division GN15 bacterium]